MSSAGIHRQALMGAGALAVTVTLALAGAALGSKATAGATYVGHYKERPTDQISFKVSGNAKQVIDLTVETPFKCNGGCGGVGSPKAGSAAISKAGRFKAVLKIVSPVPGSAAEGTDTVAGTFGKHGEAKGTVTSHFFHTNSGETVHWTAVT